MTTAGEVVDMRNGSRAHPAPRLTSRWVASTTATAPTGTLHTAPAAGEMAESGDRIWWQVKPKFVPEIVPVEG